MSDIYETDIDRILADNIIFRSVTGSKAYGLDTVTSDTDIRGVYISPPGARLGLFYTEQKRGEIDDTHFCDVSQFFKHVVTGAPNWVESLFVRADLTECGSLWQPVMEARQMFLTKTLVAKSIGFMLSSVRRSNNAQERKGSDDHLLSVDRKRVMHAVRMGRMLLDLINTGDFLVDRTHEREELLALKHGTRSLQSGYDEIDGLVRDIKGRLTSCSLPEDCDPYAVNRMIVDMVLAYWIANEWISG
jgi:hypothetical protein